MTAQKRMQREYMVYCKWRLAAQPSIRSPDGQNQAMLLLTRGLKLWGSPGAYIIPKRDPSIGLAYCIAFTFGCGTSAKEVSFGVKVFPSKRIKAPLLPIWSQ